MDISTFGKVGGSATSRQSLGVAASRVGFSRRIMKGRAPEGTPGLWTLALGHHEDRTPTHGYAEPREAAMAAFAKSWSRE